MIAVAKATVEEETVLDENFPKKSVHPEGVLKEFDLNAVGRATAEEQAVLASPKLAVHPEEDSDGALKETDLTAVTKNRQFFMKIIQRKQSTQKKSLMGH